MPSTPEEQLNLVTKPTASPPLTHAEMQAILDKIIALLQQIRAGL